MAALLVVKSSDEVRKIKSPLSPERVAESEKPSPSASWNSAPVWPWSAAPRPPQKSADALNTLRADSAKAYAVDVADFDAVQKTGEQDPRRLRPLRHPREQRRHHPRHACYAHVQRRLGHRSRY